MTTLRTAGLAISALMMMSGGAYAASVESQLFPGKLNQLSDNSAEYLLNCTAAALNPTGCDPASATYGVGSTWSRAVLGDSTIDVGDRIRAIYNFNTVENLTDGGPLNSLGLLSGNNELTVLGDFVVGAKVSADILPPFVGDDFFVFSFIPYDCGVGCGFDAELAGLTGLLEASLVGSIFGVFEDTAPPGVGDFSRIGVTVAADEATATDGTFRAALGFGLDPDETFFTVAGPAPPGTDDILAAGALAAGTNVGITNVQVSFLVELFPTMDFAQVDAGIPTGVFGADGLIDVNGSSNTIGILGIATDFDVFDNTDITLRPVAIPEPGSVALLSIGLLGLAGALRRRKV